MAFLGNNDCTITAINVSGGITCARTSGQTPMFVQVSASAITCTGTRSTGASAVPYEDLEFAWDFGDPSGTETFTHPATNPHGAGTIVNANTQTGPEAAYCYRSSGTFTVTLTIRGKNGSGFTTNQTTQNITVSAFNPSGGEFYFDSVNGLDGNSGTDSDHPKQSLTAINAAIANDVAINLSKGSTWTGTINASKNRLRIRAYGSGAAPIINATSGRCLSLSSNGTNPITDVVISGLTANCSSSGNAAFAIEATDGTGTVSYVFADNLTLAGTSGAYAADVSNGGYHSSSTVTGYGFWNCSFSIPTTGNTSGLLVFNRGDNWYFLYGGSLVGQLTNADTNHLTYSVVQTHTVHKWISFRATQPCAFCINGDWDNRTVSTPDTAEFWYVGSCNMEGAQYGSDMSQGVSDGGVTTFQNIVFEDCNLHGLIGFGVQGPGVGNPTTSHTTLATFRDNRFWNCTGGQMFFWGPPFEGCFYRNYIYRPTGGSGAGIFDMFVTTWTGKLTITDNILQDVRTSALMVDMKAWADAAGSTINRNQYYGPNDSNGNFFGEDLVEKSLAQWQANGWDLTVTLLNPNWHDPANGDFTVVAGQPVPPPPGPKTKIHGHGRSQNSWRFN